MKNTHFVHILSILLPKLCYLFQLEIPLRTGENAKIVMQLSKQDKFESLEPNYKPGIATGI